MRVFCVILGLCGLCFAACAPVLPPTATAIETTWGPAHVLALAEQGAPAALAVDAGRVFAAWVGSDERGVHHDARVLVAGLSAEAVTLPLPPVHPYAQQAYSGLAGNVHLLWLDANATGVTELYSGLISAALTVERGPTPIATGINARRYAALPAGDGGLTVLWSGAALAEPSLFLSRIDLIGRPLPHTLLADNADYPALVRTHDGSLYAFWLNTADGRFYSATVQESSPFTPQRLPYGPELNTGDQLHGVYAATDTTHLYVFWTVQRANGFADSWVMISSLADTESTWTAPQRLALSLDADAPAFETGFNSGPAIRATLGEIPVSYLRPLASASDVLPVAAHWGDHVGVVYFQAGEIVAAQPIAAANLIAAPAIAVDQSRFLYLAWAQPNAEGRAALLLATLQNLGETRPQ